MVNATAEPVPFSVNRRFPDGKGGVLYRSSPSSYYTGGPRVINEASREAMREILREIQDGSYAEGWIRENRDQVEALRLACTSPRDLTRSELKALRKQLQSGFGLSDSYMQEVFGP